MSRDFPGSSVAKTPCFQCGDSISVLELISYMLCSAATKKKKKKIEIKKYCLKIDVFCFQIVFKLDKIQGKGGLDI